MKNLTSLELACFDLFYSRMMLCTMAYCTMAYCTMAYCTMAYCAMAYCAMAYCTMAYCAMAYCAMAYCTMAYCTIHEKTSQGAYPPRRQGTHRHTPPRRRHHRLQPADMYSGPFNDTGSQKDMVSPLKFPE